MDLLQLRYFRVIARVEHMTEAAEELSIAQPSLSKTIGRLEKESGTSLLPVCCGILRLSRAQCLLHLSFWPCRVKRTEVEAKGQYSNLIHGILIRNVQKEVLN